LRWNQLVECCWRAAGAALRECFYLRMKPFIYFSFTFARRSINGLVQCSLSGAVLAILKLRATAARLPGRYYHRGLNSAVRVVGRLLKTVPGGRIWPV
jgi:hypothetical protein